MMALVLSNDVRFTEEVYRAACRKAVDIGDGDRAQLLLAAADHYVEELSPSFYGEVANYAYIDHLYIAREIVKHCTDEQIAAAPPYLLEQFAMGPDFEMMSTLVEKGISGGTSAENILHIGGCSAPAERPSPCLPRVGPFAGVCGPPSGRVASQPPEKVKHGVGPFLGQTGGTAVCSGQEPAFPGPEPPAGQESKGSPEGRIRAIRRSDFCAG